MKILTNHREETVVYAAEELKKYLDMMCPGFCTGIEYAEKAKRTDGAIVLALMGELGLDTHEMKDPMTDDILYIDVENGSGVIAGGNIRSILLSVYRYLNKAGCRFIRPGKDGEIISSRDMAAFSLKYRHVPSYPFRGECIEGAVTVEQVIDSVIWSPKVGMNMFMIQQVVPYNLMSRWYKHLSNTRLEDENVPFEEYCKFTEDIEKAIKKVGLQYHGPGHGYLFEPWGIHYLDRTIEYNFSDEAIAASALVNGKRGLFSRSPNFTQLCYSSPDVRKKVVDWLVAFVEKKPFLDFLHIWLADSINNQCECENCVKHRVSDLYVTLLNELDAALAAKGLDTKIVFILYTETNWPPLYAKLNNPNRFIMLTAIGGRNFKDTYDPREYDGPTPPYERNNYTITTDFPLIRRFIDEWKPAFDGPKFSYEYHLYAAHYNDPSYVNFAKVFPRDAKTIEKYGFSGIMNCMTQRCAFPTALPIAVYSETMLDNSIEFESFEDDYYKSAFGTDYTVAKDYLYSLSELMNLENLSVRLEIAVNNDEEGSSETIRHKPWAEDEKTRDDFRAAIKLAATFESVAKSYAESEKHPTVARSWELLYYHTFYVRHLAEVYLTHGQGDIEATRKRYAEMIDALSEMEPKIADAFDLHIFDSSTKRKLEI